MGAASIPYGCVIHLRNGSYDRGWLAEHRAAAPVISVGNLTVGGTGKTPCVEFLAHFCQGLGRRVAILSRGYGAVQGPSDETLLLRANLQDVIHITGKNRCASATQAVDRWGAQVALLDDGFQHRRLARDFDLVLIDASNPWGNGALLPRGLLREPLRALRRAHAVLVTRCDQVTPSQIAGIKSRIGRENRNLLVAESIHEPRGWIQHDGPDRPLAHLRGRSAAAFCGVGNPDAFHRTLIDLGCRISDLRVYPDHRAYSRRDVVDLIGWARSQVVDAVVTTQKDLVKLRSSTIGGRDLLALRIGLRLSPGGESEQLLARLRQVISA
jgi:tetraacyldisaccharide 4'-kinase